jgi:DNA polymerase-3 subunit epsilon
VIALPRLPGWLLGRRGGPDAGGRWVVVDTETSGLDPARDALLAIGAVALDASGVRPGDSFEMVLRNTRKGERTNIALHGIGREAQRAGTPPADALRAFAAWAGACPRFAFHAPFDRAFVERAARNAAIALPRAAWIDVAPLAAAFATEAQRRDATAPLDDWLTAYGIECDARHNAASDAFATAELLLRIRAAAARQGATTPVALARLARQARWLGTT